MLAAAAGSTASDRDSDGDGQRRSRCLGRSPVEFKSIELHPWAGKGVAVESASGFEGGILSRRGNAAALPLAGPSPSRGQAGSNGHSPSQKIGKAKHWCFSSTTFSHHLYLFLHFTRYLDIEKSKRIESK